MDECSSLALELIHRDRRFAAPSIATTLERFGIPALRFARDHGISIVPLRRCERYDGISAAIMRLAVGVDEWPAPPAGLFVVEERTMYLRSRSPMTVAHEFGHALDCALGGGTYLSGVDPILRKLFVDASAFVTPYAASGIDEYFAEAIRAYVEINDVASPWPRATKARLRKTDSLLYDYIDRLFRVNLCAA